MIRFLIIQILILFLSLSALYAQKKPADPAKLKAAGLYKYNSQNYEGAIKDFTKVLDQRPEDTTAVMYIAHSYRDMLKFKSAVMFYDRVLLIDSLNYTAMLNKGKCRYNLEDYKESMGDFLELVYNYPDSADAYYYKAMIKCNYGNFNEAIKEFDKTIEIKPNQPDAYFYRAEAKNILADHTGACEDWRKAASLGSKEAKKSIKEKCGN
jgi:tetratricopeptide (TPR) repeat protein